MEKFQTWLNSVFLDLYCVKMDPIFVCSASLQLKKHQKFLLNLLTFKEILPKFVYPLLILHNQSHANVPILPYVFFCLNFLETRSSGRRHDFFMKCFRLPTKVCSFYYHHIFILAALKYYIL